MIASFQKEMKEVEHEAIDILRLKEPLYCETSVDLKVIKTELQRFKQENENNKDNALKVIEIFEEIEREETVKVSELFGSEDPISKYFNEITNGLYEEVFLDQGTMKIQVKRRDGKILTAEKLSGGAYDQLYLSIRLALGEKLLKGKKGFFIMDDPLVKADPDRLQRQIQTLKKIAELGWQVTYFSAKGEIKDALKEDIKGGAINYVEIQGIFS
jgi:exonuclease SbcC